MKNMMNTKFCDLSSLVLVDILTALPMEHVVRTEDGAFGPRETATYQLLEVD